MVAMNLTLAWLLVSDTSLVWDHISSYFITLSYQFGCSRISLLLALPELEKEIRNTRVLDQPASLTLTEANFAAIHLFVV